MDESMIAPTDEYDVPAIFSPDVVVMPHTEFALTVSQAANVTALDQAMTERQLVALIPNPGKARPADGSNQIGTLVMVRKLLPVGEGGRLALLRGLWRIRVKTIHDVEAHARVRFTPVQEVTGAMQARSATMRKVLQQIDEFVRLIPGIPMEIISMVKSAESPGKLADLCAYSPEFTPQERLELLRTLDPEERLQKVSRLFEEQLARLRQLVAAKLIPECDVCMDLADRAFDAEPNKRGETIAAFLNHVIHEHTGELLTLLAEKYGPVFMARRSMR
jgi:ATP-dependent Lon protease